MTVDHDGEKIETMEGKPNPNTEKLKKLMRQLSDTQPKMQPGSLAQRYRKHNYIIIKDNTNSAFRYTKILFVVALYWFVSITLVFLNKSLLSGQVSVDAPLFVTCFQCVVTAAVCYAIVSLPSKQEEPTSCTQINISLQVCLRISMY